MRCDKCSCDPCCCKEFKDHRHVCIFGRECWCGADSQECLAGQSSAGWPKTSDSLAVHPKQIQQAMEKARLLGVPTNYTALGQPILTDPGHQKKLTHALGYVDRGERNITMPKGRKHDQYNG